jgi:proteasome lid subunit RPN8/RPN11
MSYPTAAEAAQAALTEAMAQSKTREYAGVIYEQDGEFHYTTPKTSGETHAVKIKVQYPKGSKLVSLYHTHPDGTNAEMFSHGDIQVADQLGLPYYMGHSEAGFRVYEPGKTRVTRQRTGRRTEPMKWSKGDPIDETERP